MEQGTDTFRDRLNSIREPRSGELKKDIIATACVFLGGAVLGIIAKFLDSLALEDGVWWHNVVEKLDLGNFLSEIGIWLLLALAIAVFSRSPIKAAVNVLAFFAGMCAAYHIYTMAVSGFDPGSYMMIWYGITAVSPFLALVCWYGKGKGIVPVIIDTLIMGVFWAACFAMGQFYVDPRSVLYTLVFIAAAAILYRDPKQLVISLAGGFVIGFLISPRWPYN